MIGSGRHRPPPRQTVVYGKPVAEALPDSLAERRIARVLLVTNASLAAAGGPAEGLRDLLGDRFGAISVPVRANTPWQDVAAIAEAMRSDGSDAVVAFGGGSVVEAAKAARFCVAHGIRDTADLDRLSGDAPAAPLRPHLVSIPTTLSAADYTPHAGATDQGSGRKHVVFHPDLAPDTVILDPAATFATPSALWLGTGVRAIDHAVETWCAPGPTPYSDATSSHAARLLFRNLPESRSAPDDPRLRLACQTGSWLSIQGAATGVPHGASHAIGHALVALEGIAHGITSGVLLPHVLRFNAAANAARQAALREIAGQPDGPLADAIARIVARLGLPGRLRDVGVAETRLRAIAELAAQNPRLGFNPRRIDGVGDVLEILEAAW